MRKQTGLALPIGAALVLAGCGIVGNAMPSEEGNQARIVATADGAKPAQPPAVDDAGPVLEGRGKQLAAIPEALHGIWALEAADCAGGTGAAERLLTITPDELRQFGARARLNGNVIEATPERLDAEFAFERAGETWRYQQGLRRWGDKLVRRDGSQTETSLYFRCP